MSQMCVCVCVPVQSPALWAGPPSFTCLTKIVSIGSRRFLGRPGNNDESAHSEAIVIHGGETSYSSIISLISKSDQQYWQDVMLGRVHRPTGVCMYVSSAAPLKPTGLKKNIRELLFILWDSPVHSPLMRNPSVQQTTSLKHVL